MTDETKDSAAPRVEDSVQAKLRDKTARIGVLGMGYVGLPLALLFAEAGLRATGFDVDPEKVEKLRRGQSYIRHIPEAAIGEGLARKTFCATTDFSDLREMDAILICVPTPLDDHREPDLSFVRDTTEAIVPNLRSGQLVVLESTTYPGTTEEVVLPILKKSGLRCPILPYTVEDRQVKAGAPEDTDFYLAFSPEREDPGNREFRTPQIPKLIGGVNAASAQVAQSLYDRVFEQTLVVSSTRVAEMSKILENTYRCVNIALVNELKLLCLRMGIDIWEVIAAARTKPFGFTPFYPGPGLGGHCIPIDPFYLTWKAREYEFATRFIELAGEINSRMPEHVVASLADALNRRRQCLRTARVLVLGVAYKKDVDDLRESPSLRIMELLQAQGAQVDYHDPYFPLLPKTRKYDFKLRAVEPAAEALAQYDAVIIATDHSSYDYTFITRHDRLVIDTRNATREVKEHREKIVRC